VALLLSWLSKDGKFLLAVRPLQTFSATFVSIFFAVYLSLLELPLWMIGVILTGGQLFSTAFNMAAGFVADRVGRRRMLVFFGLLVAFSGVVFATVSTPMVLIPVAVISTLGSSGGFGPANMLERVILAQSCPEDRRTRMYAIRSTLNSVARSVGSLFVGAVVLIQGWFGLSHVTAYRWMFGVYAILNLVVVALYSLLSREAEVGESRVEPPPLSPETKGNVLKLSLLFSLDSLGSGFIPSSLVSYWFFDRFGLDMDTIALIFSGSSLLAALSFMLAARISERIGLINTMVYSHLPSNLMTMSIPYMPSLAASSAVYMGRSLLSQMDVPTRQSYVMAIVKPEERSRVAGLINLPRSLTSAIGPTIAGFVMQFMGSSLPFLFAGGLKAVYDLALYFNFRDVKPPEEQVE
jgi:MFS family permease